jgi:hypothetical protein
MLCGDFNARIGNLKDFIIDDPFSNIEHLIPVFVTIRDFREIHM